MTVWGYARVSTVDQDPGLQFDALHAHGIDDLHIETDKASGAKQDRPGLTRLLAELERGDVLTVWKLDRLGRSMSHLVAVVDELGRRGIEFRSLTDAIDTTTPAGRFTFHLMASVAQFERKMTAEGTRAALAAARKNKTLGRPSSVNRHQFAAIHRMAAVGDTQSVIASTAGLSRAVVGRVLRGEIASLARFDADPDDGALPLHEVTTAAEGTPPSTTEDEAGGGPIAAEGSDGKTRPAPGVSAGPASKNPTKKRTRKKWYVVETERQHADNLDATVAILSECTTAKMAERTRQQLQSRANKDPYRTALIAVRTAEQIHSHWGPYDPDLDRHPITKGPPR